MNRFIPSINFKTCFLKKTVASLAIACLIIAFAVSAHAVTTSWKGTTSISWIVASNWTNGVPGSTVDAIIGDGNFTGSFQPELKSKSSYCKTLTIGNAAKSCTLTLGTNNYNLIVLGDILIGANGKISQSAKSNLSLTGNWTNQGNYDATNNNAGVVFSGVAQTLTGATTFKKLNINAGSTTTLANNITVRTFSVTGTFDPLTYLVTLNSGSVNTNGIIRVKASTFDQNYSNDPALAATSTVNYAATSINQTVKNLTYGTLSISGALTKSFSPGTSTVTLQSSTSSVGNIRITGGTLQIPVNCTLSRGTTVTGGVFTISNNCFLKTAASSFPANFATYTLGSTSTTEYNGDNQAIAALTYGHLIFSSAITPATKTMPSSSFTIAGTFTSSVSAGTMIFSALSNITVLGNVTIGAGTTFNGGAFSHTFESNLTNAGTINGGTGTITMAGLGSAISGLGSYNLFNLIITRTGNTVAATTDLVIGGNLTSISPGVLTHTVGSGKITMSGTGKSIIGQNFTFNI
jgi:hypothetical protein